MGAASGRRRRPHLGNPLYAPLVLKALAPLVLKALATTCFKNIGHPLVAKAAGNYLF